MKVNYKNKFYLGILSLFALLLLNLKADAANRYWIATTASNWNSTSNWSTTSGGASGASVPGNSDVAIFNNLANGDCNINAVVNVQGFTINGYSGSISQNANTMAIGNAGFNQNAGNFIGGSANITISASTFTLSGGTFTSTSANLSIGGSQGSTTIFTHAAGTFIHNNGTVVFNPQVPGCVAGSYNIDVIPATAFYNITLNGTQSCGNLANITTAGGDNIDAANNFTHTDGVFNGSASFKNNLIIGASADGGSGTITADGTGAQNYTVDPAVPRTAHLIVNKSAGAITPNGGTTALSVTKFSLLQGDFTAPSGNFRIGGSQSSSTIFTHSAGTFSHNNGTAIFDPQVPGCVAGSYDIDIIPATNFYNVTIAGAQSCGNLANINTAVADVIIAQNDFTHTDGVFNGAATFANNLIIGSSSDGGSGSLTANGTGAQTYTVDPAAPRTAHLIVNKASGALSPNGGTTALSLTKFSLLLGNFTAPTGNFRIGGAQSSSTIFTHTAGTFSHNNGTTIFDPQVPGCVAGSYDIDVTPTTDFYNVVFSGTQSCGNLANINCLGGDVIIALNDLTHTDGVFNGAASFKNNLIIGASSDGGNGTITADGTGAQTYTVDPAAPRTAHLIVNKATGALTPNGGTTALSLTKFSLLLGDFTAPSGNLNIGGAQSSSVIFTHTAGNFTHNNGTTIFDPQVPGCVAGSYTIDLIPATRFYNVTINGNQSCGNLSNINTAAGDTIDARNDFTHTDGVFNGFAEFKNNLIIGASGDGGSGVIIANGTGAQTYSVNVAAPRTAHLIVDKTSGALTPAIGTNALTLTKFSLLQGSFTAPTGNFSIGGAQSTSTIFTHTGGTFSHNNGTTIFDPQVPGCVAGTYTIDVINSTAFRDVIINGNQSCGNLANINTAAGDTIDATNDLTHTDGVFNGFAQFKNNLIIGASGDGGSGALIADGTGAQTYSVNPAAPRTAHLIVNKTSGALAPAVGTNALSLTKFSLLQGAFTAPTGNFSIGGAQSTSTIFTHTAGTFNHNNGLTIFDPQVPGCVAGSYTIDVVPSTAFFNVTFNGNQSCGNLANINTAVGDTIDATNDLVHTDGVFNGFAQFKKDLYINASADGGTGTIISDGTAAQTYNVDASAPRTAHLVVNKTANSLNPGIGTTLLSLTKFTLLQGTFVAPSGNFRIGGSQSTSTIFTHTAGTFNHNNGVTIFDPQVPGCVAGTYTIDVSNATLFNYVTISGSQSCGNLANLTTAVNDTIDVLLDLTHADGVFNGLAATQNNLIVSAGADGGAGSFLFTGVGNQTYNIDPAAPRNPNIVVRKGTGTVTASSTTNWSIRGLTIAQGSFDAPTGILNLSTNFGNSGTYNHNNGNVTFAGTSTQTIGGSSVTTFYDLNTNNAANVSLSQNCTINNDLTFTNGRFVINARRLFLGVNTTITASNSSRYIQSNGLASGLGVEKSFAAGTANFTFPIGTSARYTPVNYNITANSAPGTINIQPVTGAHPSTTAAANTQLNYYWKVLESGFSGLSVTHTYNYIQADVNGTEASYVTGRFVNPLWTPLGGIGSSVNAAANTMTLTGVNYLVGDYTAGLAAEFQSTPAVVITASPSGSICSGTNVTFTAVPTNGGVTPAYQWQLNGVNVGTNSTTYSNSALVDGDVVTCLLTSSIPASFPNPATSNPITMTVIQTVTPAISISASPGNNICNGSSVTFTATITDGGTSPSFQWKRNGANVGANSPTYTLASPTNGDIITCVLTSNAACRSTNTATSAGITLTVSPVVAPTISIAATPSGAICNGTSVTFNASTSNGGAFPTYQWKLNGSNVGTNTSSYTNAALANGDIVTCQLTSNATCSTPTIVNSNSINMSVNAVLVPAVTIAASPNGAICSGTSVTFTPTPTNGGVTPTYEWFKNGISQGFSATYTSNTLANGNTISAIMTSSLSCATPVTASSNTIAMTVNTTVTPSVSISITSGTNPTCTGNSITFTATPTNGGASPTYQWTKNGVNIGGANAVTYTGTAGTAFVNGDLIRCVLTSNATCASPVTATSSAITMSLTPSTADFYITGTLDPAACNRAEEAVKWRNLTNVVTTGSGNSLNKTTSNNNWDGNAYSYNTVSNNGYLEFTATETNTSRMIGLSNTDANSSYSSIRYAVYLQNNGTFNIFETGINRGSFGNYAASDVFRVSVENSFVKYYRNNSVFYTSALVPSFPMFADVSINNVNGTITNAFISNLNAGVFAATVLNGTPITYQWRLNGSPVGTNSPTYTNVGISVGNIVTCDLSYTPLCSASPVNTSSNAITFKALPSYGAPSLYVAGTVDPVSCNRVEEEVRWTNLANVVSAGSGNSLNKTTSNNNWDGGAYSLNAVSNNGYLEFTVTETNTSRMIGLSNSNADNGYSSIKYAIYLQNNGSFNVFEQGVNIGSFGAYAASDVYRVSVENSIVKYYRNNAVFYTSALVPSFPMYADVSINSVNGTITNAFISNLNSGTFTATMAGATPTNYQWRLNGSPVGTNAATYINGGISIADVVTCDVTYTGICSTPTISSNNATYRALPTYASPDFYVTGTVAPSACNRLEEEVRWSNLGNVVTTGSGNSLNKTTSNNNWDGGAYSYNSISNNGYLEFTATETNTSRMIGLSNTNADNSYSSIKYAIYLQNNGTLNVFETGINRGSFGSYAASDVFRVSVENNVVKYYRNGTVFYTSALVPSFPMYADVSINNVGGTITNALISNLNDGSFTATVVGATPVTYQWLLNGSPVGTNSSSYTNLGISVADVVTCELTYVGVCGSPMVTSNTATFKALPTYATPDFYITGTLAPSSCNRAEETVRWSNLANLVTTGGGNGLNKTLSNGNWDGGAFSYNAVHNNGYLEFTATETNTSRMIGLSNTNADNSYSSIRYAVYLQNNGSLNIFETGINRGSFGGYAASDVFKVSVENNVVKYYRNGAVFYTSALVPSFPMYADVSINNVGGTITNALISNLNDGTYTANVIGATPTNYQWRLNGSPVGTNAATYTNAGIIVSDVVTCDLTYSSICATPTISSNTATYKLLPTYATPDFYITGTVAPGACNRAEEVVRWSSLANVLTTGGGNSLNKNFSNGNWDGGAYSYNSVSDNGYLEFTATETNTSRMIGLSNTNADNSYSSIRYAIYLQNNGTLNIFETGINRGSFGNYAASDVFRVSVENGVVKYYRNNTVFYSSALVPSFPMHADVSINNVGGTITNALISNLNAGTFTATLVGATPLTYQWRLNGSPVGTNAATYTNGGISIADVVTCDLTYSSICATPVVTSNTATYKVLPTYSTPSLSISGIADPLGCYRAQDEVRWINLANVVTTGSGSSLNKTASNNNWDGGAFSLNSVANNGYLEFTAVETNRARMVGLSNTNVDNSFGSIRYAIYLQSNGTYNVYESGVNRGSFGTYTASNLFRISVESNVVKYYRNGSLFYTSAVVPTLPLYADVSINQVGGTVSNATISNLNTGTFTAQLVGASASNYQWRLNGSPVGTNAATYTNGGIVATDVITCDVTYTAICSTPTITSNTVTIINGINSPALISIAASPSNNVCSGVSVTFTATPTNGGGSPGYQWTKNGVNIGGANSVTYTGTAGIDFANTDLIRCELTSNATCAIPAVVTSSAITMTVNPVLVPTISITSSQTNLCTVGMDFSASISNGGGSPAYQWKKNGSNILGAVSSTYTSTSLINGDIITCELTSNATCASPTVVTSNSIAVTLTGAITTWLGNSSDWSIGSPLNWDNGYPSSNVTAIIPAGTPNNPVINDIVECFNIEIQTGASLTISAVNQLNVYGKFTNDGTFNAGFGSVEFLSCSGSSAQAHEITSTNGTTTTFFNVRLDDLAGLNLTANADITGALTLTNGTFTNASNVFTFKSTASATARIAAVPATANYVGNITMERFAPGPKTGWAQLGTPIQGATLAQWQDDFATSGYTGATGSVAGFISVYTYNETTPGVFDAVGSYVPATNVTNSIPVGKGFWLYLGTASVNTANITIDVTGQPTVGNFNFNPNYTNSGNPFDDGFNLVANPYPSAIDWLSASWTKTNINNAIYMYQADNGQYASFVGGVSTNGGSRFIASSQGFYIQANAASPVLNITENAKTASNPVLIKDADPANVLRIKINGDGVNDETVIHINEQATTNFDGNFDAKKMFSNDPSNPSISSINNNKDLSINTLPFSGTSMSIPVRVTVGNNGMYNLSWSGMEGFPQGSCFVIEDLDNGNKTTLEKDGIYYFNASVGFKAPRFVIHISTPLPRTVVQASCSNSADGSITLTNTSNTVCKVQLKDANGKLIKDAEINGVYTFANLTEGNYQLIYPTSTSCGNMIQMVQVTADKEISANFEASSQQIKINDVVTFNTPIAKGDNITWNFGDGTTLSGVSTSTHQYQKEGIYTVSMTNQKGECSSTETMLLNVTNALTNANNSIDVNQQNGVFYAMFNFTENTIATIRITNTIGQEVATTQQFEGKIGKVRLQLDGLAEGVYMVIINNGTETLTKKIIK